jgi:hypothetical protein
MSWVEWEGDSSHCVWGGEIQSDHREREREREREMERGRGREGGGRERGYCTAMCVAIEGEGVDKGGKRCLLCFFSFSSFSSVYQVGKRELVRLHTIDFRGCGVPLE